MFCQTAHYKSAGNAKPNSRQRLDKISFWEVFLNGRSLGIIETNYKWASSYWSARGAELREVSL